MDRIAPFVCFALLGGVGCGGDPGDPPAPPPPIDVCTDTWENWGQGFLRTWCTSCHSSGLPEGQRYGAPVGLDYDDYAGVVASAMLIAASATGEDPSMPPVGGPPDDERERLATWVSCGTPGADAGIVPPCDGPTATRTDPVVVDTTAGAEALCADGGLTLQGGLTVTVDADLPCVCQVDGAVTLAGTATAVSLADLTTIGEDLVASAPGLVSLDLGSLAEVGGRVTVTDADALAAVRLPYLTTVVGDLILARLGSADRIDLSRLATVGGDLVLDDVPHLAALIGDGYALQTVQGDLVLSDLDDWLGFYGFAALTSVGGTLRVEGNDRITQIHGFTLLTSVGGISIADNAKLDVIDGFDTLPTVSGDLVVASNPVLFLEEGFAALTEVTGALSLVDNPALQEVTGLVGVARAGSVQLEGNGLADLGGWTLVEVDGDLVIQDHSALKFASLFPLVETIGGTLSVIDAPQLELVTGLDHLESVAGLVLVDLGDLAMWPAMPLLTTISGPVTVRRTPFDHLDGFAEVQSVGAITLDDNAELADLQGLAQIENVAGDLTVTNNAALPTASVQAWVAGIDQIDGLVTIEGNQP